MEPDFYGLMCTESTQSSAPESMAKKAMAKTSEKTCLQLGCYLESVSLDIASFIVTIIDARLSVPSLLQLGSASLTLLNIGSVLDISGPPKKL